ncbi:MAG: D-sedoheptulose-7-phosphate isomerase, partial [Planctomycetota bacterium]
QAYADLVARRPDLGDCLGGLMEAHVALVEAFEAGGKLLLAGNGGSFADALHISGELLKSFERDRGLSPEARAAFADLPGGEALAAGLEQGFPAVVLGNNASLASATLNDTARAELLFAQECYALARPGDVLLVLSTSGDADDLRLACSAARAREAATIPFLGKGGGVLRGEVEIAVVAPGQRTRDVQEEHVALYHALCAGVEAHFHPRMRGRI